MDEIITKKCSKCREVKNVTEFYTRLSRKGETVFRGECKKCRAEKGKEWIRRNPEARKKIAKRWELKNPDKRRFYKRTSAKRCSEKNKPQKQKYRTENAEKIAVARKKYNQEHREENKKAFREWSKNNQDKLRANRAKRRAIEMNAPGGGFTAEQDKELKKEYFGMCAYCGSKTKIELDHVVPLISGGRHDADNIVPACKSCNSRKRKLPLLIFLYRKLVRESA